MYLKDISSIYAAKEWLRQNIDIFKDKDISSENMLIFLEYLREKIFESNIDNKNAWLKNILELKQRISVINE
jgi:hypothetical protein